jgi:hypothetical protein
MVALPVARQYTWQRGSSVPCHTKCIAGRLVVADLPLKQVCVSLVHAMAACTCYLHSLHCHMGAILSHHIELL